MTDEPVSSPPAAESLPLPGVPRRREWLRGIDRTAWGLVLGTTLLYGAPFVFYPFGIDQLYYTFLGDCIMRGILPYRDFPMMQMPLTGGVAELALLLFGRNMLALRVLDLLWTAATGIAVYGIARRMFSRRGAAIAAGVLYPILYYLNGWWHTAQPDGFLNLPVCLAFLLMLPAGKSGADDGLGRGVRAGVLLGLALLFKYSILPVLPVLVLAAFMVRPARAASRIAAGLLAGCVAVAGGFMLVVVGIGVGGEFLRTQTEITAVYARTGTSALPPLARLRALFATFWQVNPHRLTIWFGLGGLAAGFVSLVSSRLGFTRRGIVTVFLWLAAALLAVLLQGKMIVYHYLVLVPPVALLGGVLGALLARPVRRSGLKRAGFAVVVLGLLLLPTYARRFPDLVRILTGRLHLQEYWRSERFIAGDYSVDEVLSFSDYLAATTEPGDRVAHFALTPHTNFPVWHDPVVRFSTVNNPDPKTWRLPADFRRRPPKVFAFKRTDRIPWVRGHRMDSFEQLVAFTELKEFLAEHYELEARIRNSDVLRRANSDLDLPGNVESPEILTQDLHEALDFVATADSIAYRHILWPFLPPEAANLRADRRYGPVLRRMMSQREFNRHLWLNDRRLDELLPVLSVWVRNDDRPFAALHPYCLQDDTVNFTVGGRRFSLLHMSRQGTVVVYLIE